MVFSIGEKISFLESVFGKGSVDRNSKNIAFSCPICKENGKNVSVKKKLVVRIDIDVCHCWVCGWSSKTVLPLIKKFGTYSQFENFKKYLFSKVITEEFQDNIHVKSVCLPHDFTLLSKTKNKHALNYLFSRDLSFNDVEMWNLGTSSVEEYKERIIIPSFDRHGKLNYVVARSYNQKHFRKYYNSGVEKNDIVFNEFNIDWTKDVIICEGPFDMFKCGRNSIPLLGSELSENSQLFTEILVNSPNIVLALDRDAKLKTIKVANLLNSYDINIKIVDVPNDPGSLKKEEFQSYLSNAKPWSWTKRINTRIEALL